MKTPTYRFNNLTLQLKLLNEYAKLYSSIYNRNSKAKNAPVHFNLERAGKSCINRVSRFYGTYSKYDGNGNLRTPLRG